MVTTLVLYALYAVIILDQLSILLGGFALEVVVANVLIDGVLFIGKELYEAGPVS